MSGSATMTQMEKNVSKKHPSSPMINTWINIDGSNPHTYKSSNLRSFRWSKDSQYTYGKLIVRFQGSGSYVYDLPKEVFDEMAKRAFNPNEYNMSTGEWYSNKFFNHAKKIYGLKDTYYIKKIDI